eukprot:605468-Pyramimonas_sp.AAC.1
MVANNFCSTSGCPAKAYTFLCVTEQSAATYEDLQDSGDSESIDCKLAAGLTAGLTSELRYRIKNLTAQEHKAGRMLKGREIYWTILQSYKVTTADDTLHDFERLQLLRMRDDDLQRFIVDWGNLCLECREPPDAEILESLFRAQIRRHYLTKQDMHDYNT